MPNWFIALPVAGTGWFERVPAPPAGVRLFGESDLHMTVAFLGGVPEARARAAFELAIDWPLGPIGIALGSVRPMGNPRHASALSIVLEPSVPPLMDAMSAVRDGMLECAGARLEHRPPLPHITIARIERRAKNSERKCAIAWAEDIDLATPRVQVERIALYTWSHDRRTSLFRIADARECLPP